MRKTLALVGLTLLMAALFAAPATAAPQHFDGRFVVTGTSSIDPAGCHGLRNNTVGSGQATVLGPAHWTGTACIGAGPHGIFIRTGQLTLAAAHGDKLFITFEASGPPPNPDGTFTIDGTYKILGGAGRFAGATGGGSFSDEGSLSSPRAVIELAGTIELHRP